MTAPRPPLRPSGSGQTPLGPAELVVDRVPILGVGEYQIVSGAPVPRLPVWFAHARRPDDLFVGRFVLRNLILVPASGDAPARLQRWDAGVPASITLELPPQSFAEEAFLAPTGPEVKSGDPTFPESESTPDVARPPTNVPTTAAEPLWRPLGQPAGTLPAARVRMSGPSRLAATMPASEARIDFTCAALLDAIRTWPMRTADGAIADPIGPLAARPAPSAPRADETALELPWRLILSPVPARHGAGVRHPSWQHRSQAVTLGGRQELWHTRLRGDRARVGADQPARVRALWSDDFPLDGATITRALGRPFRTPLDALDRQMLVKLGADHRLDRREGGAYVPRSATADRLILTPLGGLLDLDGRWDPRPEGVDLAAWRHLASLGRDHYVRVVYQGYLLPFGHAASLIKVTERVFEPLDAARPAAGRVAVLRQRFFIVVRQSRWRLDAAVQHAGGRTTPFREVELLTRVTPNLQDPAQCQLPEHPLLPLYTTFGVGTDAVTIVPRMAFWPRLAPSREFHFEVAATDRAGRRVTFAMPMAFVGETAAGRGPGGVDIAGRARAAYNRASEALRRTASLGGQLLAWIDPSLNAPNAPVPDAVRRGDASFPTDRLRFRAVAPAQSSVERADWCGVVEEGAIGLRPVRQLLGRDDAPVTVSYDPTFETAGFGGPNAGQVFLRLATPRALAFGAPGAGSDTVGGLATPSLTITGLSRVVGLAADLDRLAGASGAPTFHPSHFLGDARILGGIFLRDLLGAVPLLPSPGDAPEVVAAVDARTPKLSTHELPAGAGLPARLETRYTWNTQITKRDPAELFVPGADGAPSSPFRMQAQLVAPLEGTGAPTARAEATIENFKVNMFGFVLLWFTKLRFTAERGAKPDVAVDLHPSRGVEFGGPLEFVNRLKELIPSSGFSDPPTLEVTPSGIGARYELTIPNVQVGIFALSNASLGARFALPFDARPMEVGFHFSERENPFSLTVSLLGGGGFFAIGIGADGVKRIEAALEFGAQLAIDLGVASGSVEVKAGVYFAWLAATQGQGGSVELTGYVRIQGELSVIGLISVSLTFNVQLSYKKLIGEGRSLVWGEATLVVEVEVLVFSGEVSITVRREFGGSDSDPTIADLLAPADWTTYCLAFAPEP